MAAKAAATKKNNYPVNLTLTIVLGVVVVCALIFAISNHTKPADPTLTAAPPIVATPGHPIVLHTKSPEVYALEMKQAGMPVPAATPGQPASN